MAYLEELLPEFRKGAKIRRKDWDEDVCIYFEKDQIYWKDNGAWKNGKIASTKDLVSIFTLHHNDWELYQEPEPDWDYIIKNKCLCWFWDDITEEPNLADRLLAVVENESGIKYMTKGKVSFAYCRPVRRDEVTFYEERKEND